MRRSIQLISLLIPAALSGCALIGVDSRASAVQLLPGTAAHADAQQDLQRQVDRQVRRHVNQTGACKVQAHQHGKGRARARRFNIECVGDSRYEAQVINAVRELATPQLTHFRFIVASPGWKQVMRWDRRIGRQTQFAIYDPGLAPQASSAAPHDRVLLSAAPHANSHAAQVQGGRVGQAAASDAKASAPEPVQSEPRQVSSPRVIERDRIRSIHEADPHAERWFVKLAVIEGKPSNRLADLLGTEYAYSIFVGHGHMFVSPGFKSKQEAQAFADRLPSSLRTDHLEIVSYQHLRYANRG